MMFSLRNARTISCLCKESKPAGSVQVTRAVKHGLSSGDGRATPSNKLYGAERAKTQFLRTTPHEPTSAACPAVRDMHGPHGDRRIPFRPPDRDTSDPAVPAELVDFWAPESRRPGFSSRIQTGFLWIPQRFSCSCDRTGFAVNRKRGFRNPAMFPAWTLTVPAGARLKFSKVFWHSNKGGGMTRFICCRPRTDGLIKKSFLPR